MNEETAQNRRIATSFWLAVGVLAVVGMFKSLNDTLDPDCFWHLRVAEQLHRDGIGPIVDHLSFASIKQPWTPYSWLAELAMHGLWSVGGYRAAVVASALLCALFVAIVALLCIELAGARRRMNAIMMTALAASLSLPYLSFRPATAAIVLLGACGWLLLCDRRLGEKSRGVWLIVPITAILANVHLTAVVAPISIGCLLIGAIIEGPMTGPRARRYAMLLLATSAACLATPMLGGVVRSGWDYQFHDVMVASGTIEEMRPAYASVRGALMMSAAAALVALGLMYGRRRVRIGEWLWLAAMSLLVLRLGRFAPIFAIIAAPVLAASLPALPDFVLARRGVARAASILIAAGLLYSAWLVPGSETSMESWLNRNGPNALGYPCTAADFVERHVTPRERRLINEFTWGGYLAWRLGDRYEVFLDGRTQLYTADFWRSTYLCDDATRVRTFTALRADVAILPARDSVFRPALARLEWSSAYRDDQAEVMLPPPPTREQAMR